MDTPRTNLGDATYLGHPPLDFDMTQEPSFVSPKKDSNDLLHQLRNGGRAAILRTPRANRAPLGDRPNAPAGLGGSEFTPMLKSATRNSARRRGKENKTNSNNLTTPALTKIEEDMDMTNVPVESSLYGPSRNLSYVSSTPLPEVEESSAASTPLVRPTRRGGGGGGGSSGDKGPLQDGNQLSLREQENVIDKIEKENFGLKLKIHFLEEALRKTGPGFSEAALKENTELKVDKVTMQRELSKYKKHLASAEKDLETYQHQILEVQDKAKKKYANQSQKAEIDELLDKVARLEDDVRAKDREIDEAQRETEELRGKLDDMESPDGELGDIRKELAQAESELRSKDRDIVAREEELDQLEKKLEEWEDTVRERDREADEAQAEMKTLRRKLESMENADGELGQVRKKLAQAEADLRSRDQNIAESEEELEKLEKKMDEMDISSRRQLDSKEAEIESLQQQLQVASQGGDEVDQLRKKLAQVEADLRAKDQDVVEGEEEMDKLEKELQEIEASSRRQLDSKDSEISSLQRQLQTASQGGKEVDQLRRRLESKETEIDSLQRQLQTASQGGKDVDLLRRRLEIKESEIDSLQRQLQTASQGGKEVDQLRAELAKLRADLRTKQHAVDEAEVASRRRLEEKEAELADVKRQLQKASQGGKDVDRLRGEISGLQTDLRTKTHEIEEMEASLHRRLEGKEDEINSLQRQLQQALQGGTDDVDKLRREVASLKADLRAKDRDIDDVIQEREAAERERSALTIRLEGAQKDLGTRTDEKLLLQVRHDTLSAESTSLQREVSRLQKQIADLRAKDAEIDDFIREREDWEHERKTLTSKLEATQRDLSSRTDEKLQLETRLDTMGSESAPLQREITRLQKQLADRNTQGQRIEALEDEVDVLQAALDESEDTGRQLREANETCASLRRQLREQIQRTNRLGQLEGADKIAEELRQQLAGSEQLCEDRRVQLQKQVSEHQAQAKRIEGLEDEVEVLQATLDEESEDATKRLREADELCNSLRRQLSREQERRTERMGRLEGADKAAEDLREKLAEAEEVADDWRAQLIAARQELDQGKHGAKELRQKLERARRERTQFSADKEKLQYDCDRLRKELEATLEWIQAQNAEKSQQQQQQGSSSKNEERQPTVTIKPAAMATFRYGDVVMDVVDQKDHEAVIRAADSAQRRHVKEIRGMNMYVLWMQARWEREWKLRNDGAGAKRWLLLQLEIAEACNKAQLRRLNGILANLGLKNSVQLLEDRKSEEKSSSRSKKPLSKLRVFVTLIRAVARMKVDAMHWAEHEKTRKRLAAA